MQSEPPKMLLIDGRFEVISPLGEGGMGAVYLCRQLGVEREVAVKVMHGTHQQDRDALPRFEREAQTLSLLKHKNIVAVYGYGMHHGEPYIAMEFVCGKSLNELLAKNEPMQIDRVLDIAAQVCEALVCAHSHGIIHRDIKPNNIVVTADGGVKLIDFGLAKITKSSVIVDQGLTEAGSAVGSAMYMSPEQCLAKEIDGRSDLYALACVMYHCATGEAPFTGDHAVAEYSAPIRAVIPRQPGHFFHRKPGSCSTGKWAACKGLNK